MHQPPDVLHKKGVRVVGTGNIVADVLDALFVAAANIPAARHHLLAPDGSVTALRQHVVLGAKEQMCDQWATDALVPRLWVLGQRQTPDLADVLDVLRVVQVQLWQLVAAFQNRDRSQVDADGLWAWRPLESTLAAQDAQGWYEGLEEGLRVVRFGGLDKTFPVDFAESLAHAALEPNAGPGLLEEGTPALGGAVAAEVLHCMARCLGVAVAEAQQWQILFALHECQTAILGAMLMCACLVVSHRTFECGRFGAKLGRANMGCARTALSSLTALGWQSVVLLWLLLSVPTAIAASLPLEGPDAAAGQAASEPSSSFSTDDFTHITPGSFDVPLDFLGGHNGRHGRELGICVRVVCLMNPAITFPTSTPR